jgi:hypothetical protein
VRKVVFGSLGKGAFACNRFESASLSDKIFVPGGGGGVGWGGGGLNASRHDT